ncbi:hypothetical protein HYU10_01560 [Candidatus Woesearchaeota archaeon]|nr:hypothetical protein [Candidatus Woesearchaeota archaeon]MBI2660795.1 hypothetical protein [Candidatus Woesearchaeota archaeon]
MNKKILPIALVFLAVLLFGCNQKQDFNYGLGKINSLNQKYGVTMTSSPAEAEKITAFVAELEELKVIRLAEGQEAFDALLDYRIHNLLADNYFIEDQLKYGARGTTVMGFGCKGRYRILNSSRLRMMSASEGYKAAEALYDLAENHPEESAGTGVGLKEAMFLNASSYKTDLQAKKDNRTIENLCPEEEVQRILKEEETKKKLFGIEE